jgi:5'-nucleotidase/UDP-sugar diphosphatase
MRALLATVCLVFAGMVRAAEVEAIAFVVGDLHSAYVRTAQLVARIDRIRADNPGVPAVVLLDGDTFEFGNAVARRSEGAVEFAMFAALAKRGPTVLNLGNHEPEFFDMAETVTRVEATGVTVVSNAADGVTGKRFAPASFRLKLGAQEATVVGICTDRLATYRVAVRPTLDLADPVVWAKQNLAALLQGASLPVVLSHAGLRADRTILPLVPDGTLFAGAHDHLRFVHREGRTVYFHSGSWTAWLSVVRLRHADGGLQWDVEQVPIGVDDPADPELGTVVHEIMAKNLTTEERSVVGHTPRSLTPDEAAQFAVHAARLAAGADVAIIGGTTFGAGLPAGDVTRFALDACVRFDGTLFVGEVDGAQLREIIRRANQGPDTPFAAREGENLVADAPADPAPGRRYRLATSDWIAHNPRVYLGENPPALQERPGLKLKAAVIAALAPAEAAGK